MSRAKAPNTQDPSISGPASSPDQKPLPRIERRSQRVHIEMAVLVYGHRSENEPFQEEAQTVTVNAHGGLLKMASPVAKGQQLMLTNPKTMAEVECSVVQSERAKDGETLIAIEFKRPSPRFWGIHFPPADWNPAERKRPSKPRHP